MEHRIALKVKTIRTVTSQHIVCNYGDEPAEVEVCTIRGAYLDYCCLDHLKPAILKHYDNITANYTLRTGTA